MNNEKQLLLQSGCGFEASDQTKEVLNVSLQTVNVEANGLIAAVEVHHLEMMTENE